MQKTCVRCGKRKAPELLLKLRAVCKECERLRMAAWRAKNAARISEHRSDYYQRSGKEKARARYAARPDLVAAKNKAWADANPDSVRAAKSAWQKRNRAVANANRAHYEATKQRATPLWADVDSLRAIYAAAPHGWHVDHIVPLRAPTVCGLHCEANLQLLPAALNQSKGNRRWPDMPKEIHAY
jgi:hypothetical protein